MRIRALILIIGLALSGLRWGYAAQVDTLQVQSSSMNKVVPNLVVTPEVYKSSTAHFPVVYLLHGATGSYLSWITAVGSVVQDLSDRYNIIIVCPDGASTSWYIDSPVDSTMRYETYVSKELVATVDERYRTINNKSGRAVTGLSMGGHGGLYLSWRNQDVFGAGGSMSGGVDIRTYPNNWDLAKRLGDITSNPENWENHTVTNMVGLLNDSGLKIIIDCGVDDFFFDDNRELHKKLLQAQIAHDYTERPGGHTWDYWRNAVQYQLLFFHNFFQESLEQK